MKVVVYSNDWEDVVIIPLKLEDSKKGMYFGEGDRNIEEYDRTVMKLDEGLVISTKGVSIRGDVVY